MHTAIFCSVQGRPGLPFGGLDERACPCPSSSPYKQGFRSLGGRINRKRRHQPQGGVGGRRKQKKSEEKGDGGNLEDRKQKREKGKSREKSWGLAAQEQSGLRSKREPRGLGRRRLKIRRGATGEREGERA